MDTTSHNFTWQTWTFGEHSSSVLYDVAIIDENNIWAVGEIYMNDSLGNPDPTLYNLIKWDGNDWKVERVYYNYQGSNFIAPLRSIFTFSINDVWVGSNQPMHWTGNTWQKWDLLGNIWDGWINKIWGSSSSDIYVVGNGGNIAHWNGSKWTKIESGTTLDINDIWGAKKSNSEEYEIVVIASNSLQNDGREVMIIKNNTTFKQLTDGLSPYYSGVWFKPERKYYIVGGGVHKKNNITDLVPWYRYPPGTINNYYSNDIGGNNLNDIIVCGSFGEIIHFNGVSWTNYTSATYMSNGTYISVSMKSNLVVITGFEGGKAVITFGRR